MSAADNVRLLLLGFADVTTLVEDRVRVTRRDVSDADMDTVVVVLPDADQLGQLDPAAGGLAQLSIVVLCYSKSKTTADEIAAAVRTQNTDPGTGLDGWIGPAGHGFIHRSERVEFAELEVDDDDADAHGMFVSQDSYSVFISTT